MKKLLSLAAALTLTASTVFASSSSAAAAFAPTSWADAQLNNLNPKVLALALGAAGSAVMDGKANAPSTLTVIDYSLPSTQKRMWVFDVRTHQLLFNELVAHGRGSGLTNATAFSNDADSHQTSLGLFRTLDTYVGHNGYSLRLEGLEKGINDRAKDRAIVVHGARYVNAAMAKLNGYLGRSYGCPAVRPEIAKSLIDTVKGGGLLFAYYPNQTWLKTSAFLN